jgi:hypothetical protein
VNTNIDAKLKGLEVEYLWTPADNWLLTANLGLLNSELQDARQVSTCLIAPNGVPTFVVMKNASTYSNCVVSAQGYATVLGAIALANPACQCRRHARSLRRCLCGSRSPSALTTVTYVDGNGNVQTANALEPFEGDAKSLDGNNASGRSGHHAEPRC